METRSGSNIKLVLVLFFYTFSQFQSHAQIVTTVAGGGTSLANGIPATNAHLGTTSGVCFDSTGNYYFQEGLSNIRMVDVYGNIHNVAGNGISGYSGDGGLATSAEIYMAGLAVDAKGNLYIGDYYDNRLRRVDAITHIITTIAGTGFAGVSGDGGLATAAEVMPTGICLDSIGNIYFVDGGGYYVREINTAGIISTIAGNGTGGDGGDGGLATAAELAISGSLCIDKVGNIYVPCSAKIRKINIATGIISTFAGTGTPYYIGDGMPDTIAQFVPYEIGIDTATSSLFIGDIGNQRVYKIDSTGVFHLIAGTGVIGFSGDGGIDTLAKIHDPEGVATDHCGNLYIADESNFRIRKISFDTTTLPIITISTIADTVCFGTPSTYNVTIAGGYPVGYTWVVNGVTTNTSSAYTYTPADGDSVQCIVIAERQCFGGRDTVSSNIIHMIVSGTASVLGITGTTDTTCPGASLSYTATVTGTDSAVYAWYVNGVSISAATNSIYTYTPVNGDHITCKVIGANMCNGIADTLISNILTMFVNPVITPSVSITPSTADTICAGTPVTFTTTSSGGGTAPLYQWIKNGSIVDTGSSYTYTPANGDSIRCILTGSDPCTLPASISSNIITMLVNPVITPSVSITSSTSDTICAGTPVTFTATSSAGGTAPFYQWLKNGSIADTGSSYSYVPVNGDSVRCVLTGSSPCTIPSTAGSNSIIMVVDTLSIPAISVTGPSSVAATSTFTLTATVVNAGSPYSIEWYNNGTLFATTAAPAVTGTALTGINAITAQLIQQSFRCNDSAMSDTIFIAATDNVANVTAAPIYSVYPNPAHNVVTISGKSIYSITVSNSIGQTLISISDINADKTAINISSLQVGIYVLTVTNGSGQRKMTMITKE